MTRLINIRCIFVKSAGSSRRITKKCIFIIAEHVITEQTSPM